MKKLIIVVATTSSSSILTRDMSKPISTESAFGVDNRKYGSAREIYPPPPPNALRAASRGYRWHRHVSITSRRAATPHTRQHARYSTIDRGWKSLRMRHCRLSGPQSPERRSPRQPIDPDSRRLKDLHPLHCTINGRAKLLYLDVTID